MNKKLLLSITAVLGAAALALSGCASGGGGGGGDASGGGSASDCVPEGGNAPRAGGDKYVVYMNSLNIGNAWQEAASNLGEAVAKMEPFAECVEVRVEKSEGGDSQGQIGQIQSMTAAGADAIVLFAISPTAQNAAIRDACAQGVTVVVYDATVTEPCAYNVSYITGVPTGSDKPFMGYNAMNALADMLGGEGDIFVAHGQAGTSVDNVHYLSALGALADYPDIKILTEWDGLWSSSVQQTEAAAALASFPNVDGMFCGYGESGCVNALKAAGMEIPVTGETSQAFRENILAGWPGVSIGSPPSQGGIGMKVALAVLLQGPDGIPMDIEVPFPIVTAENIMECGPEGEFIEGCNLFPTGLVGDEDTADIFNVMLPEATLESSQTGNPSAGVTAEPYTAAYLQGYEQAESRRFITRETCPDGWEPGMLPENVEGCVQA